MDMSALGIVKQHRVIPITDRNITRDFLSGRISVIGVECNTRGVYGSPLQKTLAGLYPAMLPHVTQPCREKLGTTDMWHVKSRNSARRQFVANMYLSRGFGLGRNNFNRGTEPVNRFKREFLETAFDSLIENCRRNNVPPDRAIGLQRVYGGLGGVSWAEVVEVLDALCEKHQISVYVYLPKNYDTAFVRGKK
ncbi:putative Appr-1-p processing protein [Erwinia phage pEa_SNUABM_5]|uniref:Putative Appr-1-p processing protein n=1 Tax=Erwinia phage pEa_SNUABM_5 TaxID=2797313 RepID=A0A7T8IVR6_9CAUD|nr:putative Appr-1-p processing protein [Erwinia phage pEa_SNUABM_5]QQO90153.1 putative Appr-1-p processing protein [Erwinia phage pEa_SNUABM_5]